MKTLKEIRKYNEYTERGKTEPGAERRVEKNRRMHKIRDRVQKRTEKRVEGTDKNRFLNSLRKIE